MKITDKEAINQVRNILEICSPEARQAIKKLFEAKPIAPAPRSMKREDLKLEIPQRQSSKIYDPSKEREYVEDTTDDNWLNNWLK